MRRTIGMIGVERVAAAGVVGVARPVRFEDVVGAVVQAAEAQRRPALVAFGGVIEHDVENDLDARPVQRLDHVAELVDRAERILARAVGLVRREERDRRVAPVVDLSRRAVLGVELEHRQQLDRRDAELLKIRNLLDQAGERAARLLGDAGAGMAGEAAHVHLVNDGPRGRPLQRRVAFPVVRGRIDHHALHRRRGVVALPCARLAAVVSSGTTTPRPYGSSRTLAGSNRRPARRIERSLDAIAVDLPGLHTRHERRASSGTCGWPQGSRRITRGGRGVVLPIEEQQLHAGGVREKTLKLTPSGERRWRPEAARPSVASRLSPALASTTLMTHPAQQFLRGRDHPVRLEAELLLQLPSAAPRPRTSSCR